MAVGDVIAGDTLTTAFSLTGRLTIVANANTLRLQGTDHCYIELYPDGAATRKGYMGFGGASDDRVYVANEIAGEPVAIIADGGVELNEESTPSAPAANRVRIFALDDGGKTELSSIFNTGARQQITQEP